MTPEEGIAAILDQAGVGTVAPTTDPWPIFEAEFPEDGSPRVDKCIVVRRSGGRKPEVRIAIDYPTVQILTRASKLEYVTARAKIDEIFLNLQGIPSAPAEYPELSSAVAVTQPIFVGYDEGSERPVWSVNFNLIISKDPEGHRDL